MASNILVRITCILSSKQCLVPDVVLHEGDGCTGIQVLAEAEKAEGNHYQAGVAVDIHTLEAVA